MAVIDITNTVNTEQFKTTE